MVIIPTYSEAFAGNGTTGGIIQVADSRKFWPGSVGFVSGDSLEGMKVIVVAMTDSTHIRVRPHPDEAVSTDNRTTRVVPLVADLSAYTMVANAKITIPQQPVFELSSGDIVPKLPTIW